MSVDAVGAYIRTLRKLRQLTELAVSTEAGVGANYIWRIENGEIDRPSAENLAAITRAVSGRLEDIGNLLLDKAATRADGERLAERCLRATDETMQDYLVALSQVELHRYAGAGSGSADGGSAACHRVAGDGGGRPEQWHPAGADL